MWHDEDNLDSEISLATVSTHDMRFWGAVLRLRNAGLVEVSAGEFERHLLPHAYATPNRGRQPAPRVFCLHDMVYLVTWQCFGVYPERASGSRS